MNSGRWREVEAVLDATLDSDPSDWSSILDRYCADDAELRREVEALLRRYDAAQRFLDRPPATAAAAIVSEARAAGAIDGRRLGAYRIVRQIGEGGMARVYLAERDDGQFTQRVALKLLLPGRDSVIDQGRLRAERQILASLNHPNIARLLDGGMTDEGLPYLAMELIEGDPIDRHCDALTLRRRLELFTTVCDALQYAHRNLVLHRDLKSSNILVTSDGQVKLLDFGLAKLLGHEPDTMTAPLTTNRWMTPAYAAPEQLRGASATTSTDVYQLGVVLFEMLTGTLPFGDRGQSPYELAQAILEREAPQPSSVNATAFSLRGDLDAIVLKALRKEPEQRYASVEALRDDVGHFLAGMPVTARQGSTAYRTNRFVRRHRWSVAGGALLAVLLAGYVVTLTLHNRRVRATLARVEQEKTKAEGSTQFLVGLFSQNAPGFGPRDTLTAQQMMARGEQQADALRDQPLAHAQLLSVLGTIQQNFRDFDRAETLMEQALAVRRAHLGEGHADVAESMYQIGLLARDRGQYDRAKALIAGALEIQKRMLGEAHPATVETAYRLSQIRNPIENRIASNRRALSVARRAYGSEHASVAESMMRLGITLRTKGEHEEAEQLLRESLAMRRRLAGADHWNIGRHLQHLAILLMHRGELDEAEQLHRSHLAILERLFGPDHPQLSGGMRPLVDILVMKGDLPEAEQLVRRDLAIRERAHGDQHEGYATSVAYLSWVLQHKGQLHEAEKLRRRELAILQRTYGRSHPIVAGSLYHLALILLDRRQISEAEKLLLEAKAIREREIAATPTVVASLFPVFARIARERHDYAAADSVLSLALRIFRDAGYSDHQVNVQLVYREQLALFEAWGKMDRAEQQRALLIARRN